MPNIKSAKKRVLVNSKKANINKSEKSEVKTYIKNFNAMLDAGNLQEAEAALPATMAAIDKAVTKNVYAKNTAANKKSGLMKKFNALKASK
ncbi:MAG: 30S ribosomal protein S20 [Clostridia bacterium]|jgi:small subunit ribosomal protein S20|nr:30S ribosomal protein S20 [Clostridia bacterium]